MAGRRAVPKHCQRYASSTVKADTSIAHKRRELCKLRTQRTRLKQRQRQSAATTTAQGLRRQNLQALIDKTTASIDNV